MSDLSPLASCLLQWADDRLVLGHRLSEWCGHAPTLEEDIALANVALDFLGQATVLLERVASLEGRGRSADDLAFLRDAREYRNLLLVERPNGDFAVTILRQFLFDAFDGLLQGALAESKDDELAQFAQDAAKQAHFHQRHSRSWVVRLADGTEESRRRMERALVQLWPLSGELFVTTEAELHLAADGIVPDPSTLLGAWTGIVEEALREGGLEPPERATEIRDAGRAGRHSEHLGHLLAEMQILQRTHPGASW